MHGVPVATRKLESLQRKFDSKSAKNDALILKAKEDVNVSVCNLSFNASFSESMNVSYIEERLQSLSNELQISKEDHSKLLDSYKEKCSEVEELQNSTVAESASTDDMNSSIKKSPSRTSLKLDNLAKNMNNLENDFKKIKENNESGETDLAKFINEKESLHDEINALKISNEELLQKLSESELSHTTALEKAEILENKVQDITKKLEELTVKCKDIENAKLLLEVEAETLREDKELKERTLKERTEKELKNWIILEMQFEQLEQLRVACNDLDKKLEEKELRNAEIRELKTKCDELTYTAYERYDDLVQEKYKITLELKMTKVRLNQRDKDVENYTSQIKALTEKNAELDQELDELLNVICAEHDAENARLQDQYWMCRAEADELQDRIKALEGKNRDCQPRSAQVTNVPSNRAERSHDDGNQDTGVASGGGVEEWKDRDVGAADT